MWRIFDWPRTILPVPVFLKRLAAPLWVLSLGMVVLLEFLSLQHHPVYGSGADPQNARPGAGQFARSGVFAALMLMRQRILRSSNATWEQCLRLVIKAHVGADGQPRSSDLHFQIVILIRLLRLSGVEGDRVERAQVFHTIGDLACQVIARL